MIDSREGADGKMMPRRCCLNASGARGRKRLVSVDMATEVRATRSSSDASQVKDVAADVLSGLYDSNGPAPESHVAETHSWHKKYPLPVRLLSVNRLIAPDRSVDAHHVLY